MRRAVRICKVKPHGQRFSLVLGITQAHVKQCSICWEGYKPSVVGIQKREKSHLTCSSPLGFWSCSYLYLSWGRKPNTGHLETHTGQGGRGNMLYTPHPQVLFLLQGFLSDFFHLNLSGKSSVAGANLLLKQLLTFLLGERKRFQRLMESLKPGMELTCKLVKSWSKAPGTCKVLVISCMFSLWRGVSVVYKNLSLQGVLSWSSAFYPDILWRPLLRQPLSFCWMSASI